ncbi:MAG TPA: hypothetical protein ENI15_16450 [Spirochaetes bacterium]|nr:hypothetical protein [Spirochaetota bacterium]
MMKHSVMLIIVLVLFSGCAGKKKYEYLEGTSQLTGYIGKRIVLEGRISTMPWQHMIDDNPDYRYMEYFDVGEDQLVIYSKEKIDCGGLVRLEGSVIQIEGKSKRPGSDEVYREMQITVEGWECAD